MQKRQPMDVAALAALLVVGLFFLSGLGLSGGYRIYMAVVVATWAVLFTSAVVRLRLRRGGVWVLALVSPLCLLAPLLALALLVKRLRGSFVRDLTDTLKALTPASFPLGAPTVGRLILSVMISTGVFVVVVVFMAVWLGLAGGSPATSFVAWFLFAPSGVLSALSLTYLVVAWRAARRQLLGSARPD